jgi:hypothetical protein
MADAGSSLVRAPLMAAGRIRARWWRHRDHRRVRLADGAMTGQQRVVLAHLPDAAAQITPIRGHHRGFIRRHGR